MGFIVVWDIVLNAGLYLFPFSSLEGEKKDILKNVKIEKKTKKSLSLLKISGGLPVFYKIYYLKLRACAFSLSLSLSLSL
jgi:hypothetical protein